MKLTEAQFERQVRDYLEKVEGWRCFHIEQNFSERKVKSVGEPGMPDLLCIRYKQGCLGAREDVMWIEMKRKGGKAAAHQQAWHLHERKLGALTLIAGEDFECSLEGFKEWYLASGLRRRV